VLLPKWLPIVTDYLASANKDNAYDHPIFAYCTVWLFDVGNYDRALECAFKAIDLGQSTPPAVRRKWPGFIADTIFDWAEEQAEFGNSTEPYFSLVFKKVRHDWKLPEPVTAKYYKFAGLALLRSDTGEVKPSAIGSVQRLQQADEYLAKAASLHKYAQVKTVRNRIEMRIRALEKYGSDVSFKA